MTTIFVTSCSGTAESGGKRTLPLIVYWSKIGYCDLDSEMLEAELNFKYLLLHPATRTFQIALFFFWVGYLFEHHWHGGVIGFLCMALLCLINIARSDVSARIKNTDWLNTIAKAEAEIKKPE